MHVLNMVRIDLNASFMKLWHELSEHDCIVGLHDFAMSLELGVGLVMFKKRICAMVMPWDRVEPE